jgi:tyrosinase
MHLAVGGFDVPGQGDISHVSGANGDMGENDTAGLDPIFHIHHANIDRYFWLWQQQHGQCEKLEIEQSLQEFPGTNSVDSQEPTPGMAGGTWLNLDTALRPFTKSDGTDMRSVDVVNIKTQLGYTYEIVPPPARTAPPKFATAAVRISGVNKNSISGSHQLAVYAPGPTGPQLIGLESVLSRWHTSGCQNCQANSDAVRYFPIPAVFADNAIARVVTHAEAGKPVPRFTAGRPSKGLGEKIPKSHVIREGEKFADVRGKSKVVSVVSERRK